MSEQDLDLVIAANNAEADKHRQDMFDLESKIGAAVKQQIGDLAGILKEKLNEIVWQACHDYMELADTQPLEDWKHQREMDLIGARHWSQQDTFWGKDMRHAIWEEHKAEITPLIQCQRIAELEEEAKSREDCIQYLRRCRDGGY